MQEAAELRRLAAIARDAPDAIVVQDLGGRILAWNPAAQRMYGWTAEQALTMNARELVPAADADGASVMLSKLAVAEAPQPRRVARVTRDGHSMDVWVSATALVDAAGELYAICTTERS